MIRPIGSFTPSLKPQSMSRVAKCIDIGPMEGFWDILKRERYYGKRFTDRENLVKMIEDYIEYSGGSVKTAARSRSAGHLEIGSLILEIAHLF